MTKTDYKSGWIQRQTINTMKKVIKKKIILNTIYILSFLQLRDIKKKNMKYLKRILSCYLKFLKSSLKVEQKRIKYQVTNQARAGELTTEKVLNDNEHYVWGGLL